ncbi:Dak phosphatase [Mollisia scopiformis]|uniref:Dak phosphatase n=1 Tax=Mollisia scopiformis TaxID=149040 RepID=A0A194X9J8_MOLSC|nr:Dak phosphatase [Mollisia scopiformis]KUJ16841.1 Dak phosphatase [Mollisia scopiformis]
MSLVVDQTLPYTHQQLQFDDPNRWSRLFPLMRPSVRAIDISNGQTVVIDTSLVKSKDVLIAAIGSLGAFSSKILSESHLATFTSESTGKTITSAEDISKVLKENGFTTENGLVVVRSTSKKLDLEFRAESKVLEVAVIEELELDHILSLLSATQPKVKASLEETKAVLEHFIKSATKTNSTFHEKKAGNGPSVVHTVGTAEFNSAKKAIDKDLAHLLSLKPSHAEDVVYSVHFSDINGLSRLENNILAHEISEYFAKKNLPLHLTQSSISNPHPLARGWSISLTTIPLTYLSPQQKPTSPLSNTSSQPSTTNNSVSASKSQPGLQFSAPLLHKIITAGCENLIRTEPLITEYDTIVGDGDCGYTLRDGAKQVLAFISLPTTNLSHLPPTLSSLVELLEISMGGTSGALYCIFLSSLSNHLSVSPDLSTALSGALTDLLRYTRARRGDRTCLDCLIPFVETLGKGAAEALEEARKGVEGTKRMEAMVGRSSYLDESATRGVPDPGAYGLLMLLEGMVSAL